jgi:acetolactate synthase-1/2/3 large subunit
LAKHEFSAVTMADGYSRGTSRLGVVMATSGGGALNLVPGLGESLASRVPILALVGQAPTTLDGRGSFQDTSGRNGSLNAEALFGAVSVHCRRITTPADIVTELPAAVAAARTGGPAVLLLPKDIQQAPLAAAVSWHRADRPSLAPTGDPQPVARALRRAQGPVTIIAGEQVARDDARAELEELRATLRARVATVPEAKDVSGSPGLGSSSTLGVTGVMGHPGVPAAVAGSAVCLLLGTRLSVTARAGLDKALSTVRTISVGSSAPHLPCTHVHADDLRVYLTMLLRELSGDGRPMGVRVPGSPPPADSSPPAFVGAGIGYRDAMSALDAAVPDDVDIVVDAGNTGAAAIHHLPVRRAGRFVVALGMGGMGYAFGAGIGMAFGRKRQTVVVAGDGAFFMHGMEVHTALQYGLPVTFVLFNNNAHAMCVTRERLFFDDLYTYNRFKPSNLGSGLAAMFPGLPSVDVSTIGALPEALRTALAVDGPSVVCVECSADEIPPFAPFHAQRNSVEPTPAQSISTVEESTYHAATRA